MKRDQLPPDIADAIYAFRTRKSMPFFPEDRFNFGSLLAFDTSASDSDPTPGNIQHHIDIRERRMFFEYLP